jgi:hypothetical protein
MPHVYKYPLSASQPALIPTLRPQTFIPIAVKESAAPYYHRLDLHDGTHPGKACAIYLVLYGCWRRLHPQSGSPACCVTTCTCDSSRHCCAGRGEMLGAGSCTQPQCCNEIRCMFGIPSPSTGCPLLLLPLAGLRVLRHQRYCCRCIIIIGRQHPP